MGLNLGEWLTGLFSPKSNTQQQYQSPVAQHQPSPNTTQQYQTPPPKQTPQDQQWAQKYGQTQSADGVYHGTFGNATPTPTPQQQQHQPQQPQQQQHQPLPSQPVQGAQQQKSNYQPPQQVQQYAQIFQKNGIPPALGLAIWAQEGRGSQTLPNPNDPMDIGALTSNPQNAKNYKFNSPEEGIQAGADYLKGQSQYQTPQVKQIFQNAYARLQKTGDVRSYLQAVGHTYASDQNWATNAAGTPEFNYYNQQENQSKQLGYNIISQ